MNAGFLGKAMILASVMLAGHPVRWPAVSG